MIQSLRNPDKITTQSVHCSTTDSYQYNKQYKIDIDTYYTYNNTNYRSQNKQYIQNQIKNKLNEQYNNTKQLYYTQYKQQQSELYDIYRNHGMVVPDHVNNNNVNNNNNHADYTLNDTIQSPINQRCGIIDTISPHSNTPGIVYKPTLIYYIQQQQQQSVNKPIKSILDELIEYNSTTDDETIFHQSDPTTAELPVDQSIHHKPHMNNNHQNNRLTLKQRQAQQIIDHTERMINTRILAEIKTDRDLANTIQQSMVRQQNKLYDRNNEYIVTKQHIDIHIQTIYELNQTIDDIKTNLHIITNRKHKVFCIEQLLQCQVKIDSLANELMKLKNIYKSQQAIIQQHNRTNDVNIQVDMNDIDSLPQYHQDTIDKLTAVSV